MKPPIMNLNSEVEKLLADAIELADIGGISVPARAIAERLLENEQYRGWAALPDPKANGKMSRVEAALFLAAILTVPKDYILEQPSKYIRQAQQAYHPDRAGTEEEKISRHEMFVRIGQAEEALLNGA